jgi:hypothetical protein
VLFERDGDEWEFAPSEVWPEDGVSAADLHPADHGFAIGFRGDQSSLKEERVADGEIDGDEGACREDGMHGVVFELDGDGLVWVGDPLTIGEDLAFGVGGGCGAEAVECDELNGDELRRVGGVAGGDEVGDAFRGRGE